MKNVASSLTFLVGLAAAAPSPHTRSTPALSTTSNDKKYLNYAGWLAAMEDKFYSQAMTSKFKPADFAKAGLKDKNAYEILLRFSYDTYTIDELFRGFRKYAGLPLGSCTYNFGLTTVPKFIAEANMLSDIFDSAYMGIAATIDNPKLRSTALQIASTQGRQSAYLRTQQKSAEYPEPVPLQPSLSPKAAYSLLHGYTEKCSGWDLGLSAFPKMTYLSQGIYPKMAEVYVTLQLPKDFVFPKGTLHLAWAGAVIDGSTWVDTNFPIIIDKVKKTVSAPLSGAGGQNYVFLVSDPTFSDNTTLAGPAIVYSSATNIGLYGGRGLVN